MPTTLTPQQLKTHGQHVSVWHLTDRDAAIEAVAAIVEAFPPGALVSINRIRTQLDEADIPNSARGGLMNKMCARGLLEPVFTTFRGIKVPVHEPSTGRSAHRSEVRVYERPRTTVEGG